jgi:predicted  nucleic acid-binding Zn-ribbon protein
MKAVLWRKLSFHDIIIRTPTLGGEMSAVILDAQSTDDRPIQRELDLIGVANHFKVNSRDALQRASTDQAAEDDLPSEGPTGPPSNNYEQSSSQTSSARPSKDLDPRPDEINGTEELNGQIAKISISHDGEYATAVCLAVEEPKEGDVGGEAMARDQ